MRTLLLLNCYLFLIGYSVANDNGGGCIIDGISEEDYVYSYPMKILDTQIDTVIAEHEYTGTLAVTSYTPSDYFTVTSNETHLIFKTTYLFGYFDERTPKQPLDVALEYIEVYLQCSGGVSSLPIQIAVTDINSHSPEFSSINYEFRVAAPIMPLTDFTIYGDTSISAIDIDFSNQNVEFTVAPDDFSVTTISSNTSKEYIAVFRANRVIQVIGVRTYVITATDSGTSTNPETLSSTAQFALIVDDSTSLDTPIFVRTSYSFNYTAEDDTPSLIPLDGQIALRTNKRNFLTDPILTGDFSEYFSVTVDRTSVRIDVTPKALLPPDTGSFFILTVSISTDNTAAASIIVYRKQSEIDNIPEFSSHIYTGSYSDVSGQVTLNDDIVVTSATVPTVNVSGAYSDHFEVVYDQPTASYRISVSANLTASEIKSLSYINIIIMASTGEHYDTAAVILSVPEHELLFTDALYFAEYNSDNTITVDDTNPIGFTTDASDVIITVAGTYEDNFDVSYDSQNNRYSIVVTMPLPRDTLNTEELIELVLTATDLYGDVTQSVLSIHLPIINTDAPVFSEIIYLAKYTDNDIGSALTLDHDILINNREDQENVKISLNSYDNYFEVTFNTIENKWELILISKLSDNILQSRSDLIIAMTAEEQDNANQGHAVLYINWMTEEAPLFSEAYYLGLYPESGTGVIELVKNISLTNIRDPTNVVITLDSYAEYFEITYSSNIWIITKILPGSPIVSEYGELVITLTATETGNKKVGQSVLVLDLPEEKQGPIFLDAYYLAEYPESGRGIIEFENPIEFYNVNDPSTIQIGLDNYAENFEIIYNTNRWYINIISTLDEAILHRNVELVITLIATENGNANKGESALVLKLPTATFGTAPKFSEAYYIADYPEDGTGIIEFVTDVSFLNVDDPTSLTLTLDKYGDNFDIIYQSNKWYINIQNSLDYTVLHQNVELVMTIFATEDGNANKGESALVLKLPTASYGTAPKFSNAYYTANYPENGTGVIEFASAISFLNVDDPTSVTITLDKYAANFEIIYDTNKFFINIKSSLDDAVLYQNAELIMTLTATAAGNQNQGESVLVLKLPTSTIGSAPKFSEAYYLATYPEIGTGIIEFDTPISFLNVDDPTSLTISLDNYANNFEIVYDITRGWYINIKSSLGIDVLQRTEIVTTLIAKVTGSNDEGEAVLILKLPTIDDETGPKFLDAYYVAEYPKTGSGFIEFENPITFLNVDNDLDLTISLDSYSNNFEITYVSNRWLINIKQRLTNSILDNNLDLVMTLVATKSGSTNTGQSALVLNLPTDTSKTAPEFEEAYYLAEYTEADTNIIEFENPIKFTNIADPLSVTISLDNYFDNFDISYGSNRWYITVKNSLDTNILNKNAELVLTMTASESGNINKGYSALVLKLPAVTRITAPIFSETYYLAEYPKSGSGIIEFESPIEFTNVDDLQNVKITVSDYSRNFGVIYNNNRWYINIQNSLNNTVLSRNVELVMTLTATRSDDGSEGYAALVLILPVATIGPKFVETYYIAEYPKSGMGIIEFQNPVEFLNVDDPTNLKISIDSYSANFEILYASNRWYISITQSLQNNVLNRNTELVMTMIATDTDSGNNGETALVLKLPTVDSDGGPIFSKAHYEAEYTDDGTGYIEFESAISFLNVDNPTSVTINLDNYSNNFDIMYGSNRWVIKLKTNLDETVLMRNTEIVMTMIATEAGNNIEGYSALILKLPSANSVTAPKFSKAYYVADYSKIGRGVIEFESPITFLNVNDPRTVAISLDNYSENFEITYNADSARWYISVNNRLDNSVLTKTAELIMTMIVTERGNDNKGEATLVLKLPIVTDEAGPIFSEAHYEAEYTEDINPIIEFDRAITFLNVDDPTTVTISVDIYSNNFDIIYGANRWFIRVRTNLDRSILMKNTEIVITMTAVTTDNKSEGYSALVLKLPSANTVTAPKFKEAYYLADYSKIAGGIIEFENPIAFLNVENPRTVTVSLDYYSDNFNISYDTNTDRWYINVNNNLDSNVLNRNAELVMTMIATETGNINVGESALVLKLPPIVEDIGPIFSQAYYEAEYKEDGVGVIEFESAVTFLNVDDPTAVTVNVDTYSNNFDILYGSNRWFIKLKTSLDRSVLLKNTEIVMTMTAIAAENQNKGHSALVLKLPSANIATAPKFSEAYYLADYSKITRGIIEFEQPIVFLNVEDPTTLTIKLDNYSDNFEILYDIDTSRWLININKRLDNSIVSRNTELVVTMIATEPGNENEGESALVLKLPIVTDETGPIFSEAYYEAEYKDDGIGIIEFESAVKFLNVDDPTTVKINLDNYSDNFDIVYGANRWYIRLKTNLDRNVLLRNTEIAITMIATSTDNKNEGYSALVLKLPSGKSVTAPKFSDAYYLADYSKITGGILEFETPIQFLNIDDPTTVKINLDYYSDNFEITYNTNTARWYININNRLDNSVLTKNAELIMTMFATETGNDNKGEAALVLKLPTVADVEGPVFSEAYYEAEYNEDGTGIIEFENAIIFLNVDDPTSVTISLDSYSSNFDIVYGANRWYIRTKTNLDASLLAKNAEIVMTMTASESNNRNVGYSALVLKLPSAHSITAPKFSEAYYLADYSKITGGIIEFENPIKFLNIDDAATVKIRLDYYSDNFIITYDTNSARWYINVNNRLESSILNKNAELVLTMIASETGNDNEGEAALVLKLPTVTDEVVPTFLEAYYEVEYTEETGIIEFENPITFLNVDDPTILTINLENYSNNFNIAYASNRWYIQIKTKLDTSILKRNTEIVTTMTANVAGNKNEGHSALVLKLPSAKSVTAPKFSEAYYTADYAKISRGIIEFESPITFVNVDNSAAVTISLDYYSDNFKITYNTATDRWYINVNNRLDNSILTKNAELAITMIATETGNDNQGEAALILKLPTITDEVGPLFAEAYYEAEYVDNGAGFIEFETDITFLNVDDPTTVTISLDKYSNNFDVTYGATKWYLILKTNLNETVLTKNTEIVMKMTASETGNKNEGYSALVLKLPSANIVTAPKFSEAYYLANYSKITNGIIEFENPITFLNVENPAAVIISLDNYSDKFAITYDTGTNRWYINVKNTLDDSILIKNAELVITMTATEAGNENEGYSALVLELPANEADTSPVFADAYYLVDYPESGNPNIQFEIPIAFKNIDDPSKVTITLDNYVNNFEIDFISNKWYLTIRNPLDGSVLNENTELVMSLIATENSKSSAGYSALVLKMPPASVETPPIFSKAIYAAEYKISNGQAIVEFSDAIYITSHSDLSQISITVNNYPSNFKVAYDSVARAWVMTVVNQISDDILLARTDLVVAITAIDVTTGLTDRSVVDIKLPPLNTQTSPKFSKTYYTATYTISGATPMVTFEVPLAITNRDNLADISISIDPYVDNFNIIYDNPSKEWKMNVLVNLDEAVLNAKVDLVMALLATDKSTGEIGESALVLTLPIVNNNEAPKFSRISYSGEYKTNNGGTIDLENTILITNKNNLNAITISFDDSYKNNFEIKYDSTNSRWILNTISPLSDVVLKDSADLILTLTATETNNANIGQAALVLHLPAAHVKLAPKFALAHYSAKYTVTNGRATIVLDHAITIINKEDISGISVTLDSYSTNFKLNYDPSKEEWTIDVTAPLLDAVLNSNTELILTLLANENENENIGDATLILSLPSSDDNSAGNLIFSQVHYSAKYDVEGNNNVVKMNNGIKVTSKLDVTDLTVSFENDLYAEFFDITPEGDTYVVTVKTPLTPAILNSEVSIALTIVASVDTSKSYATLVINLPTTVKDRAIAFDLTLYNGIYKIDDDSFQVSDTIRVQTDAADANVEYSLSSSIGYEEYFDISYSAKIITVTAKEIPATLLRGRSVIPLLLTVGITGTLDSSTAVLNVQIESNDDDYTPILFSNVLYHGRYEVTNGIGDLAFVEDIKIDTDEADGNIETYISNEYETFFKASYSNKVITVSLRQQLPTSILNSHSYIPVTILVGVKGTTNQASAVLNIEIRYDSETDTGSIEFTTVLYGGTYSVNEGRGVLALNNTIQVITDSSDDKIVPTISNDNGYDKYFTITYSNEVVSLGLAQGSLPEDILANHFIALSLTVAIRGTTHTSSAVLNINIVSDKDDHDNDDDTKDDGCPMKTTYIVSIVLLSILVIGLIAAAVAFYFFKLRSKNYANLDEERDPRTRYERNNPITRPSDVKHTPLDERRPTGFIFKPLEEDTTDTTNDFDKNRRKSVAFDDNVEKLQIESPIDEDNASASEDDNTISDKSEVTHV